MFDQFISEIEAYAKARRIKASTVTFYAVGDNSLIRRLQTGGQCLPRTMDRVRNYISQNPPNEEDAA